ncbi:MAG: CrcB family protein, partial [Verrucomicrobiota bacterium]
GGFTTFSAYGLETAVLIKNGQSLLGLVYAVSSSVLGILLTFVGVFLSRTLTK